MSTLSLEQQADLASLAYELGHNPKTRPYMARLIAEVDPQRARAAFPDVVQAAQFAKLKRDVAEQLDLSGARAQKAKFDEQRAKLKERYSEEELTKIGEVMSRFGTPDWEAGAVLYANEHPHADPRLQPPREDERPGATWEFPTVPGRDGKMLDFRTFASDPRRHSLDAAYNIISEFKNSRLSPAFRSS
ncbi:MAG: hypothetical protein J2P16_00630 [Mycobacterium sp.]|nr:hypothetical protein [Mycobacterium sp.]